MVKIDVNGLDLAYERHAATGADAKGPVLMVCGTGQQASLWTVLGIVEALTTAGHEVITFDNRGISPSACPTPPWSTNDMADDVVGVISELCEGTVHLVGASLGANIVHAVGLQRPDLVRSAVMLVGGTQYTAGYQPLARGMLEVIEQNGHLPTSLDLYMTVLSLLPMSARESATQVAEIEAMAGLFNGTFGPGGQHGQMAANVAWMDGGDTRISELAGMQVPCLMTANEHDAFFAVSDMRRAAATIPDCRLEVFPGAAHVPLDPESIARLNAVTVDFLGTH